MKSILQLIIPLFFFHQLSIGQNIITDSSATVAGYWQKGDLASFSFIKNKEKIEKGKPTSKETTTYWVEFSVVDANDTSYTINWKNVRVMVNDKKAMDPNPEAFLKLTAGLNFKYLTTEYGEFLELLNWKEVQNLVNLELDRLLTDSANPNSKTINNEFRKIFSSRENMEQYVMKDVQLFHSLYGGEYVLKEKLTLEMEMPNPLGGNPIPGTISMEMTDLDKKSNKCSILVAQTIDKEKLTKALSDWLEKMGKPKDSPLPVMDFRDHTEYTIDLAKGWIERIYNTRTVEAEGLKHIETREFKKLN